MVASGVPNKGTATKVKVSARYVGREAMVNYTHPARIELATFSVLGWRHSH